MNREVIIKMEALPFVSSHCPHCLRAEVVAKRVLPEYREYGVILKKIRTKTPEGKELSSRFGIRAMPTILVLDEEGKEIERLVGVPSDEKLMNKIEGGLGLKKSFFKRIFGG